MRIAEARKAIVAETGISMKQAKKAFDWRLEQGHAIEAAQKLVIEDIKLGIIGKAKPLDYSDPTGSEGSTRGTDRLTDEEAASLGIYAGMRAPQSRWK